MEDDKASTIRSSNRSIVVKDFGKGDLEKNFTQYPQVQQQSPQLNSTDNDPRNPKNWSSLKKWANFALVFANAFIGYFTSSIYMPAIHDLQQYFDTTLTIMNVTIALYILAMAIAPLFWSPFSERIGRRWVYITSIALYTIVTIICSVSKNLALFFVMRILQGVFASAGMTVGGGTIADLFVAHERGKAMSLLTLGTVTGPAVGPLVGGYISEYLGWRWIFYICTIIGGVLFILNLLILGESLYRPTEDSLDQNKSKKTIKERIACLKFDPFSSLSLLLRPHAIITCIPLSISFGWFYFLVCLLSPTYSEIYHFEQGSLGLLFITGGLGNIFGALLAGIMSDRLYMRLQNKSTDGTVKVEGRLLHVLICIPVIVAGNLMYGWFLHARLHWFAPLAGYFIMSLGTMYGNVASTSYLVEGYISIAASALATANFARNIMAMVFTLISVSIRQGLGDGWSYTLSALVSFALYAICIPILYFYGERMRNTIPWYLRNKD